MMSDYTPRARSKPLPKLPPRTDSVSSIASSSSSSSSASTATAHVQLKRARALGRGHGYSRSADIGRSRPSRSASPAPVPAAAETLATLNPRPPRHVQRQRSYSLDSSESPSPHSASDVVSWYANMPDDGANTGGFRVETEEPESPSDYEDDKKPSRAAPLPKPAFKPSIVSVTDVKSATLAFVSARRPHPTRVDPDPNEMPTSLGAALFGYKHKPIVPLQPRAPSPPKPMLSHDVRSADSTPTVSPRGLPIGLPLTRPRMERDMTFMTDTSDSGVDEEGDELFDEVAAMLKARFQPLEAQEKGFKRKAEMFVPGESAAGRWI